MKLVILLMARVLGWAGLGARHPFLALSHNPTR